MSDIQLHDAEEQGGFDIYWRYLFSLLGKLRSYYKLLVVLIIAAGVLAFLSVLMATPTFTAVAVVGPSNGTLSDSSSALGAAGGLQSMMSGGLGKLAGGLLNNKDTFDEYTQLLTSNRLASRLAGDENILRAIFYTRYDWNEHRWNLSSGVLAPIKNSLKEVLHRPIKQKPDQDDVAKYLQDNVTIDSPLTSNFVTVSLKSEGQVKSQWLLSMLLMQADNIIREDQRKDVASRISYLVSVLPSVTQSDQRSTLTDLLSTQEQSMMTIAADDRFASTLVDPPHADLIPTSPSPIKTLGVFFALAMLVWGGLVYYLPASHWMLRWSSRPLAHLLPGRRRSDLAGRAA